MNADGFSFSVMVGIAETYLPAFVLARGLGDLTAAMVATVPVLLGSVLQMFAPFLLQRLRSYRLFVVTTATIQACSMLMLMGMAFLKHLPAWAVFVPATLYWAAGLSTGPAWNLWAEQLVPQRIRSGFFARRSRLCQIGVLIGLVSGGLLLRWSVAHDLTVAVFAILFGAGALGRFISAAMLARQTEVLHSANVKPATGEETRFEKITAREKLFNVLRTMRHPGAAGRLVLFLMAVQTAVHISGPYFNPFMLKVLRLSWVDYMGLLSLGFIGKILSLPWAARFANRWGAERLLWVGSVGIVPISAMWFISQSIWFLACVQILSGLVWGCYELAMLLQFFRQIPAERRVAVLTVYNLGNSAAMVAGTFIGAFILNTLGRDHHAYVMVFVASGLFRFSALLALPGRRSAVKTTQTAVRSWVRSVPLRMEWPALTANGVPRGAAAGVIARLLSEPEPEPEPLITSTSPSGDAASPVSTRTSDGGSGGNRRREGTPTTRLPARVESCLHGDLAPRE